MKTLAGVLLALALSAAGASAQVQVATMPQSMAFGTDPIIKVSVSFRTTIDVPDVRATPDAKAQEMARRVLYDMAASECTALSEIFNAECRLGSLQILPPVLPAPPNAAPSMSSSASYDLKPKGAAPVR